MYTGLHLLGTTHYQHHILAGQLCLLHLLCVVTNVSIDEVNYCVDQGNIGVRSMVTVSGDEAVSYPADINVVGTD